MLSKQKRLHHFCKNIGTLVGNRDRERKDFLLDGIVRSRALPLPFHLPERSPVFRSNLATFKRRSKRELYFDGRSTEISTHFLFLILTASFLKPLKCDV
ncbi:hypothetical protein AAHA92_06474 [Salvia divinorum]|uniref:Uncharacterized protein n=1 Tax=Salvia divinorum TaxID=28513 RepID=A0ABD1I9R6_SALDI